MSKCSILRQIAQKFVLANEKRVFWGLAKHVFIGRRFETFFYRNMIGITHPLIFRMAVETKIDT